MSTTTKDIEMQINVTVDGLDAVDLNTVIGDEIAYYNPETEETEHRPRTLGDLVAKRVTKKLTEDDRWNGARERFLKIRDEEIRAQLVPIVTEAINGPITKTNHYGEPTSGTTTLRELVMAEVSKVINQKADQFRSDSQTMLQRNISQAVKTVLEKELSEVFAAEKAKVVAAVRAKAADLIADAVKQGVGR